MFSDSPCCCSKRLSPTLARLIVAMATPSIISVGIQPGIDTIVPSAIASNWIPQPDRKGASNDGAKNSGRSHRPLERTRGRPSRLGAVIDTRVLSGSEKRQPDGSTPTVIDQTLGTPRRFTGQLIRDTDRHLTFWSGSVDSGSIGPTPQRAA